MSDVLTIYLAYGYLPHTTGVYFERALKAMGHTVHYVGSPFVSGDGLVDGPPRPGYLRDVDLGSLKLEPPDLVLFVDSGLPYFPRGLDHVDAPTAAYLIDVHRNLRIEQAYSRFFDHVFVAQKDYVELFSHPHVEWLPLACDPEIHGQRDLPKKWDIGFVGNVAQDPERARRLELLAAEFKVNDYLRPYAKDEIAEVYGQSRIVFNCAVGNEVNMRVFEGMASGSLLVTERVANGQSELFTDGVHLIEYGDDDELLEKVRYYLDHEDEREAIARAGRELAVEKHTYESRCETILKAIRSGQSRPAPVRSLSPKAAALEYAQLYAQVRLVDPQLRIAGEFPGSKARAVWSALVGFARKLSLVSGIGERLAVTRSKMRGDSKR